MTDQERNGLEARSTPHPLDLPRLIGGMLSDIRAIAEGMAVLPNLLVTLRSIEHRVDELNDEVRKMRMGVDGMHGHVEGMRDSLDRVEPHLEGVGRLVNPLRRLRRRDSDADDVEVTEIEAEVEPDPKREE